MPRNMFSYNLNKERFYLTLKCGQIVGSKLKFENKKNLTKNLFRAFWFSNKNFMAPQ